MKSFFFLRKKLDHTFVLLVILAMFSNKKSHKTTSQKAYTMTSARIQILFQQNLMMKKKRHFDCYKISRPVKRHIRLGQNQSWNYFRIFDSILIEEKSNIQRHISLSPTTATKKYKEKKKFLRSYVPFYVESTCYSTHLRTWGIHLEKGTKLPQRLVSAVSFVYILG